MRYFVIVFCLWGTWAVAVEPNEMLSDPALEARAQHLDTLIRCVKCQSETIASSNADWAKDARLIVREKILGGATDEQVLDTFLNAYGETVLMTPNVQGANILLWLFAPLVLLATLCGFWIYVTQRRSSSEELSEEEKRILATQKII